MLDTVLVSDHEISKWPRASCVRVDRPVILQLSTRAFGLAVLAIALTALLLHFLPDNNGWLAAGKVLIPALTLGVAPGLLLTLWFRPLCKCGILGLIGVSVIIGLALVQAATLAGLLLHVATLTVTIIYVALITVAALCFSCLRSDEPPQKILVTRGELFVSFLILALSSLLYLKGSPFYSDEEQIHIGIIRRLAVVAHPSPRNIYNTPDVIYTHPYPGTHFFMAMVSDLGGIDPLFVYCKLRPLWGAACLIFLYILSNLIFRRRAISLAVFATAFVFCLNGTFADFDVLYWGQLVPYSHPSDVAMSVLLPGLLTLTLHFYESEEQRSYWFFMATTLSMAAALTISHIREIVQFLIYNGSYFLACLLFVQEKRHLRRIVLVTVATILLAGSYGLFHHLTVSHVAEFDRAQKLLLAMKFKSLSLKEFFAKPLLPCYFVSMFYGWNPVVLLLSPMVFFAFRSRPLVLLIGMSIVTYLVIIRFPLFSMALTFLTYYEVLMTPVRNVSFFVYLLLGAILYLGAISLARIRQRTIAAGLAAVLSVALGLSTRGSADFWMKHSDWLFLPTIFLYAASMMLTMNSGVRRTMDRVSAKAPPRSWKFLFALLLAPAALCSMMPRRSPLALSCLNTNSPLYPNSAPLLWTPKAAACDLPLIRTARWRLVQTHPDFAGYHVELRDNLSAPVSYPLMEWAKRSLSPDAVMAVNTFNACPTPVLLPQQITAWPAIASFNLRYVKQLFPAYYSFFDRAMVKYHTQPFFNTVETLAERLEFLANLHVTHVLIDPMYYGQLTPILLRSPGIFRMIYDDGQWAVVEITLRR